MIASKKRKESAAAQRLQGLTIADSLDEMKELTMDEPFATLVYDA